MRVQNAFAASVKSAWTYLSANIQGAGRRHVHGAMPLVVSSSPSNWTLDEQVSPFRFVVVFIPSLPRYRFYTRLEAHG